MIKLKYSTVVFLLSLLFVVGCSKNSGGDTPSGDDDPVIPDPLAATLVFPNNNEECNQGTVISDDESTVTFKWNSAENTDNYTVTVTNLNTNTATNTNASTNEASIVVKRGTPFQWYVTSKAAGTTVTATSGTWRFFNEGKGIENYAPFPAELVKPERATTLVATTTKVILEWSATDLDNDIKNYEVFSGTETGTKESSGLIDQPTIRIAVTSGNTYQWYVVVYDEFGNSSTSEVFSFKVG